MRRRARDPAGEGLALPDAARQGVVPGTRAGPPAPVDEPSELGVGRRRLVDTPGVGGGGVVPHSVTDPLSLPLAVAPPEPPGPLLEAALPLVERAGDPLPHGLDQRLAQLGRERRARLGELAIHA